jgi:hypothetical protein
MPAVQTTAKRAPKASKASKPRRKPAAKAPARPLSHAQLLKLAAKHRPPQSWYDETIDPTKPERATRR